MKRTAFLLLAVAILGWGAPGVVAQDKATREAAQKKHDDAAKEPDQPTAIRMLCDAAAMVPKNPDFQNDCNIARTTIISRDRKYLMTAEDAKKSDPEKAKRYAGYISKVDSDTYQKAQQLIKDLSAPAPAVIAAQPQPPTPQPPKDQSGTLLTQATTDFKSGNLQGAKAAAQQVTDPGLKSLANDLLAEIDKYSSSVAEGQRQEGAGHFEQAISAYETAQSVNRNVAGDDLNGKVSRLRTQIATAKQPPPPPPPPPGAKGGTQVATVTKPAEPTPEEKKKQIMAAYQAAINRKDLESAEKSLRQVVQLDPRDAGAKAQLDDLEKQVTEALNRDPEKLEKTLRDAILAFYGSDFDSAESKLNNYLRASGAKKKGPAYFYLGATEQAQGLLEPPSKRGSRLADAQDSFRQARSAGYKPVPKYVSEKILEAWQQAGL